jgi:alpha-galactosidase
MKHLIFILPVLLLHFCVVSSEAQTDSKSLEQYILTPPAPETPRINGARIFGARPGAVFLYTVPATGKRPMTFSAKDLPKGLNMDASTGRITGKVSAAGEYPVTLKASNALGTAERNFKIVIGDNISLTPPLGWNSWNCWGHTVSREKVLASARAMVDKGLIDHGWSYINIDDGWQGVRGGKYNAIQPNEKFPDMKALADQIHAMGLKIGIYSSPWAGTYAGHIGSYGDNADGTYDWVKQEKHNKNYRIADPEKKINARTNYRHGTHSFVKNDVRQWGEWGIDYLKYDWYPNDVYHVREMHDALRSLNRDVIYSLSNNAPYGDAPQWVKWANVWRTTGDIHDTWESVSALGFGQTKWAPFAGPGHWTDPDMLVVGKTGGWNSTEPRPSNLTPDEQFTHISLWALLSAPLLIGCDMAHLDDFTLSLLTNDEVIDVNQDPLGCLAVPVKEKDDVAVYAKCLEDGSMAVGLFNRGNAPQEAGFTLYDLGLRGEQTIRDLWRQQDLGKYDKAFSATVNPHGAVFLKIYPGNGLQ